VAEKLQKSEQQADAMESDAKPYTFKVQHRKGTEKAMLMLSPVCHGKKFQLVKEGGV